MNLHFSSAQRTLGIVAVSVLAGCSHVSYVKSELAGGAKPTGGTTDAVPATKTYAAGAGATRSAVLTVLSDLGFIAEDNPSTPTIRTDPKQLPHSESLLVRYSARAFVTVTGSAVTYRARFDKTSSVVKAETGIEFPEKENELRKQFFDALDAKLGSPSGAISSNPPARSSQPTAASTVSTETTSASVVQAQSSSQMEPMSVAEMQRRLLSLGYQPGPADGKSGAKTVEALKKFQSANQLPPTGKLDSSSEVKLRTLAK